MPSLPSLKPPLIQHLLKLPHQSSRHLTTIYRPSSRLRIHTALKVPRFTHTSSSHPPASSSRPDIPRNYSLKQLSRSTQAKNTNETFTSLETQQASLGNWTTAITIGLVGGLILALSASFEPVRQSQQDQTVPESSSSLSANNSAAESEAKRENWEAKMTGESQSGRPGTLTPDQEEKLRQLWIATLRVFGIIDEKFIEDLRPISPASPDAKGGGGEPQKKSRLRIFSRKHKADNGDAESTTSTDSERTRVVSGGSPADDKYGQTKQFHDTLAQQSPEDLKNTCWSMVKHDHPDALLLRFLRARKWDVDKALIMLISTMHWRAQEAHVDDDVIFKGEEGAVIAAKTGDEEAKKMGSGEDFLAQIRMGKSYLHGMDKLGRPICTVRARLHKQGEQSEPSLERFTVYTIETARMLLAPPVDTACVIFDMQGFSLANMDYAPVKFMIKCFEANYPESLGVVLVHKAPWVFQGVWKIIKGWLDPVVASKVHFTNSVDDLSVYIEKEHIPLELDGQENWSYSYIEPVPGENDRMKDSATRDALLKERDAKFREWEDATKEWISEAEKGGEVKGVKERRMRIAEDLREGYWKLDPYIRARSFYDRTGVLSEGGKVEFWPKTRDGKPALVGESVGNGHKGTETSEADLD